MGANFVIQATAVILSLTIGCTAQAAQELDYIGHWKSISKSYLDRETGQAVEAETISKSILAPDRLDLMEIKLNGFVYKTKVRRSTNLPFSYLEGYFVMLSKPSGPAVIRMTKADAVAVKKSSPNFDGNILVSLDKNQLTLKTPFEILRFQRITNSEANILIDNKVKSAALAKARSEKLFQFVRGKTYEFANHESVGFDENGERIETDILLHKAEDETFDEIQILARSIENGEFENSDQPQLSDEQYELVYRRVEIKTMKFEKFNDSGSIALTINNDTPAIMTFQLQSEQSPLYAKIFFTNEKGQIDPYLEVSVEGAVKLNGNRLEIRESLRSAPDYKTGRDHIYRFTKTTPKLAPRQAPAADVK